MAEKAAWKFAGENGLDIVVVNPGTVMGPIIPPAINASMQMLLRLLQGNPICDIHLCASLNLGLDSSYSSSKPDVKPSYGLEFNNMVSSFDEHPHRN